MWTRNCFQITRSSKEILCRAFRSPEICSTCYQSVLPNRLNTGSGTFHYQKVHHVSTRVGSFEVKKVESNKDEPKNISSNEHLLEKAMSGLNTDFHQKNRVYKNELLKVFEKIKSGNFSTKRQGLFLLKCCTDLLPEETPANRMALAEQIWEALQSHTTFDIDYYNQLLHVYIANNETLCVSSFIDKMKPCKPNITTYELMLRALAQAGDVNQTTELISNMKAQDCPATEDVFNSLIICHGKARKPENIQEILTMLKSLKIQLTSETYTSMVRAHVYNRQDEDVLRTLKAAVTTGVQFSERNIMDIVKTMAAAGEERLIPKALKYLPRETLNKPNISPLMQSVSTLLVYQNHPLAALEIYKCLPLPSFGPKDDTGLHGRSLVRDCVKASMPCSVICTVCEHLMSSGRNPVALQSAAEAALQQGRVPMALELLGALRQAGLPLRPHYFWPLMLHNAKSYGEKGIMTILKTMHSMRVKADSETVMDFVLPHVSFNSPQNLMKKLLETGLGVADVLGPVVETLLAMGQVRAASELGKIFTGQVDAKRLLRPLLHGYLATSDAPSTVRLLEDIGGRAAAKDQDWTGRFLCLMMKDKKIAHDVSDFVILVEALHNKGIKISKSAAEFCISRIPEKTSSEDQITIKTYLENMIDSHIYDEIDSSASHMPHPKTMDDVSLRAHLSELEAKGMNTRGVLRKLLQTYCRQGDLEAARAIADKCEKESVHLSAGMKAALFDLHVKSGQLSLAQKSLEDLAATAPNFVLDEYKIIDLARLMVQEGRVGDAISLLEAQAKRRRIQSSRNTDLNCWRLLDAAAAAARPADVRGLWRALTGAGYCRPSNRLLGPLVRAHLRDDKLDEAVKEFVDLATVYKKTPLKHELLCKLLCRLNDGRGESRALAALADAERAAGRPDGALPTALRACRDVHGKGDLVPSMVAALADVGYRSTLKQLLLEPKSRLPQSVALRICARFADEGKVAPLEILADLAADVRFMDAALVYDMLIQVYEREDDYKAALDLFARMQEKDLRPSHRFVHGLTSMLTANRRPVPADLAVLAAGTTSQDVRGKAPQIAHGKAKQVARPDCAVE